MLRKKKALCLQDAVSLKGKGQEKKSRGQSTIEYIILVAAVIAAILVFSPGFRTAFQQTLNAGTNGMQNMALRLSSSRPNK
ncbi:MAG: class III signal peptide-containing protein [Candidatus Omnitrophica bacterium]|nr:class III signal peptide-containing protein [Candidatus Omnitrophota bacterium]